MRETTARILSALESADSGWLEVRLWHSIYVPESILANVDAYSHVCSIEVVERGVECTSLKVRVSPDDSHKTQQVFGELLNCLLRDSVERALDVAPGQR